MAVKGELLTMDLDGNGNKQYRVLSINNNIAKVFDMSDISTSQRYYAVETDYDNFAYFVGTDGYINATSPYNPNSVRPAFAIDLSKISYTRE